MAKKRLLEAGYPNAHGIPVIHLNTTSSYIDLCEYIQHAWEALGFMVKVNVNPPSTHRHVIAKPWLLCSNDQIVWVVGSRIDERFKLVEKTQKVYLAELNDVFGK